jgi:mycoredoxin
VRTNRHKVVTLVTMSPSESTTGVDPRDAQGEVAVTMYWRPGCGFCSALQRNLDRLGVAYERRNIWDEPEAAAFVRSVARGNETVPTMSIGSVSLVNPSAAEVVEAIESQRAR